MKPLAKVLDAIERGGFDAIPAGNGKWKSRCPAHEGEGRSLSIGEGADGTVLVRCFAHGCTAKAVVEALGLDLADLFPEPAGGRRSRPAKTSARPATAARRPAEAKSEEPAKKKPVFPTLAKLLDWFAAKRGPVRGSWSYRGADGKEIFRVLRTEEGGKKEFSPVHRVPAGWSFGDPPGLLPLFDLPELDKPRVIVTEGEKCAKALAPYLPPETASTTSAHGSKSPQLSDWSPLAGRSVLILPDHDEPGRDYCERVLKELIKLAPQPTVRVVELPTIWKTEAAIPDGGDAVDWLAVGLPDSAEPDTIRAELDGLFARPAFDWSMIKPEDGKESSFQTLNRIGSAVEVWKTPDYTSVASVPINGHTEHYPIQSSEFRSWLVYHHFADSKRPASGEAIEQLRAVYEARARFEGRIDELFCRVAARGETLFLDLGDERWHAAEIRAGDWRVIQKPPVRFRRSRGIKPLPMPSAPGELEPLRELLNLDSLDDWLLLVAWLSFALTSHGAYPVLVLEGEQGSAKSTTARMVRALIDPSAVPLRSEPESARDLAIAASNSHVLAIDNISRLPAWLSDGICSISTGGGFATRRLHSDNDEAYFYAKKPFLLNGIIDVATRPDLIERMVQLHLPTIAPGRRRSEREVWRIFDDRAAGILGGLLTLTAAALRELPSIELAESPRMRDFALWGCAVAEALGLSADEFTRAYSQNMKSGRDLAVENSIVAQTLLRFASDFVAYTGLWEGTSSELLVKLGDLAGETTRKSKAWPRSPRALTRDVERCAPVLRSQGVSIERRKSTDRLIRIVYEEPSED